MPNVTELSKDNLQYYVEKEANEIFLVTMKGPVGTLTSILGLTLSDIKAVLDADDPNVFFVRIYQN